MLEERWVTRRQRISYNQCLDLDKENIGLKDQVVSPLAIKLQLDQCGAYYQTEAGKKQ